MRTYFINEGRLDGWGRLSLQQVTSTLVGGSIDRQGIEVLGLMDRKKCHYNKSPLSSKKANIVIQNKRSSKYNALYYHVFLIVCVIVL